jgi:hypothetical protein
MGWHEGIYLNFGALGQVPSWPFSRASGAKNQLDSARFCPCFAHEQLAGGRV